LINRDISKARKETIPEPIKEKNKKSRFKSKPRIFKDNVFKIRSLKKK
jgi:hypothetical protein